MILRPDPNKVAVRVSHRGEDLEVPQEAADQVLYVDQVEGSPAWDPWFTSHCATRDQIQMRPGRDGGCCGFVGSVHHV